MAIELIDGIRVSNRAKLTVAVLPADELSGNAVWVNSSLITGYIFLQSS